MPAATKSCALNRRGRFGRLAIDELEEGAAFAGALLLLVEEREAARIELLEPLVPGDVLELVLPDAAGEVDPQDPGIVAAARLADARRGPLALLPPTPDGVVVGGGLAVRCGRHGGPLPAQGAQFAFDPRGDDAAAPQDPRQPAQRGAEDHRRARTGVAQDAAGADKRHRGRPSQPCRP